jgi:exosortase/archaeosortase family protein
MALLVLTMAFAYVTQRRPHRMVVLVVAAIPIAILANAVRVAVIAVAVQYVGPHAASGAFHHAIGKGVWALTLVSLAAIGFWLRGRGRSVGTV